MANVNRIPRGLLAYLDSQTQGENPSAMGEVVAPVLQMEPFYRSNCRYEHLHYGNLTFDTVALSLVGNRVRSDEMWLVHSASLSINNLTGAAATISASISLIPQGATAADYCTVASVATNTTVADQQWLRIPYQGPIIVLAPGMGIFGHLDRLAAAGAGLNGYLDLVVNRMQI